jgi:Na+/melibiose symporter-like transporter
VSVLGLSVSGISTGDGKVVLIVAAAAFIVLGNQARLFSFFDVSDRVANVVSAAAAALCLIVAIADMNEFAAIGLYLLLLASVVWAVAAVVNFRARTAAPAEPPTEPADAETSSGS